MEIRERMKREGSRKGKKGERIREIEGDRERK